jgi:hypothetical protein
MSSIAACAWSDWISSGARQTGGLPRQRRPPAARQRAVLVNSASVAHRALDVDRGALPVLLGLRVLGALDFRLPMGVEGFLVPEFRLGVHVWCSLSYGRASSLPANRFT